MATSDWTRRFLRINDAEELTNDTVSNRVVSKPCVVAGCSGTMYFHEARKAAEAAHTLEWPWLAYWHCSLDTTHVQLIAAGSTETGR
jgi:hypothetical protein